jgi:hypothetical protein
VLSILPYSTWLIHSHLSQIILTQNRAQILISTQNCYGCHTKRDPDADSDVEAEETIPAKKIKLEDVQVEETDGESSLAGDKAGKNPA